MLEAYGELLENIANIFHQKRRPSTESSMSSKAHTGCRRLSELLVQGAADYRELVQVIRN